MILIEPLQRGQVSGQISNRRASSVKDFLMTNGIDEIRLVGRGYGEGSPLVPNVGDENRAKNRRVEIKVLSVGS